NVNFNDVNAPEDYIKATYNIAYTKILKYLRKLKDALAYYAAYYLYLHIKGLMDKIWAIPLNYDEDFYKGCHTYKGWLDNCHVGF
ncbi:hypothetical protein BU23DRAFT_488942, partial [Bimuria novae-zelandiae CBS 107.79]